MSGDARDDRGVAAGAAPEREGEQAAPSADTGRGLLLESEIGRCGDEFPFRWRALLLFLLGLMLLLPPLQANFVVELLVVTADDVECGRGLLGGGGGGRRCGDKGDDVAMLDLLERDH